LVRLLVAGILVFGVAASAHHSFVATYHEDQTVKIEGTLVQFMFRNPHSFVHVEAPDENQVIPRWTIEWGGAGQLTRQGVTRETLKVGDKVVVTGNPGRTRADHRIRMKSLLRTSDGFGWGGRPGEVVD
jgi:hypothetical protein